MSSADQSNGVIHEVSGRMGMLTVALDRRRMNERGKGLTRSNGRSEKFLNRLRIGIDQEVV